MKVGDLLQKDGRRVSFLIPQDAAPPDLINAPMGTKFMIAYALYTEEEPDPASEPVPIARARKRPETEGERAVQQCGILCRDANFQLWMSLQHPHSGTIDDAVRDYCGVTSRAHLATNEGGLLKWFDLERRYREWASR